MLRVASLLGLLIVVLTGALFAEFRSAHRDGAAVSLSEPRRPPASPAGLPARQAVHRQDWVNTILARPLFSPARRPAPTSAGGASGPGDLARLTGVLVSRSERHAIFAAEGGKPIVAEEGSRIGAYVVRTIEPGQVTVTGPTGERVLQPTYDPKAREAGRPAAPPRPAPPRTTPESPGPPRVSP